MHELKLETIGVGEEHRIVVRLVPVLGGGIQNLHTPLEEQLVEVVYLLPTLGVPGEVVQARRVPVVSALA